MTNNKEVFTVILDASEEIIRPVHQAWVYQVASVVFVRGRSPLDILLIKERLGDGLKKDYNNSLQSPERFLSKVFSLWNLRKMWL